MNILFAIRNVPRRSSAYAKEVRDETAQYCQYKGRNVGKKLYIKFILTVLSVSRGLSLSTRNAILLYANHVLS